MIIQLLVTVQAKLAIALAEEVLDAVIFALDVIGMKSGFAITKTFRVIDRWTAAITCISGRLDGASPLVKDQIRLRLEVCLDHFHERLGSTRFAVWCILRPWKKIESYLLETIAMGPHFLVLSNSNCDPKPIAAGASVTFPTLRRFLHHLLLLLR